MILIRTYVGLLGLNREPIFTSVSFENIPISSKWLITVVVAIEHENCLNNKASDHDLPCMNKGSTSWSFATFVCVEFWQLGVDCSTILLILLVYLFCKEPRISISRPLFVQQSQTNRTSVEGRKYIVA